MLSQSEISDKISRYEDFVNNTLKPDLQALEALLRDKSTDLKHWIELTHFTKLLKSYNTRTQLDLTVFNQLISASPFEVFAKAQIEDFSTVLVRIGCDCLLEMDLEEAEKYARIRISVLEKEMQRLRESVVHVKVNTKIVLLAINELNPVLNASF